MNICGRWGAPIIAALSIGGVLTASLANAAGFDVGGLIGGLGGIVQGAAQLELQKEQMQRQLQMQQQILRQQQRLRDEQDNVRTSEPAEASPQGRSLPPPVFQLDDHSLGGTLSYADIADLRCQDSEQFSGFQWCRGSRGVNAVLTNFSFLRSSSGNLAYFSKYYATAVFNRGAVKAQIDDLSRRYRANPNVITMPSVASGEGGVIATWGEVKLVKLGSDPMKALVDGTPLREGILIDFLGNVRSSARRGLPVFRLSGGSGAFWTAQWDREGKGSLRLGVSNASAWEVQPALPTVVADAGASGLHPTIGPPANPPPVPPPTLAPVQAPPAPPPAVAASIPQATAPTSPANVPPASAAPANAAAKPSDGESSSETGVSSSGAEAIRPSLAQAEATAADAGASVPPPQGKRVALVIGNSAYRSVPRLPNPAEDADAVADTLRMVGFDSVVAVYDTSLEQMKKALRDFEEQADDADWAVVYYAGHGMQIGNENYLIPVDAHLASDQDVEDEAYAVHRVLDKMRNARKLHLVILDACRDNPFRALMKRRLASRGLARGLAAIEPAPTEVVLFAARDGAEALDGDETSGHSPFAKSLIARLAMRHVEMNKMFRLITADVLKATGGLQQPFVYGSIPGTEDFYFRER